MHKMHKMHKIKMQQLRKSGLTHTPTDIPHVRSHCGLSLNSPEGRDSVADLKTFLNTPDAALTARGDAGQDLRVPVVYLLNIRGKPLMPTSPRKARILLKANKAKVVKRTPFTLQLTVPTGESKQAITLGVDSGYSHIGLSAITEKTEKEVEVEVEELYAAEVKLRDDLVKLNSERRQYRRARRNRKTWYRKARFLNRKKPEGWLPPSIQHKLESHIKVINQVKEILPISQINLEVAAFDIQKLKEPQLEGVGYQSGEQRGFGNVREYVLYRDGHKCQHCQGKSKDAVLEVHHMVSRQIGGDRPDNLLTLCSICHQKVSQGKIQLEIKEIKPSNGYKYNGSNGYKSETFMSIVRWKLVNRLREMGDVVSQSYGYLTKQKRIAVGLEKSHLNDAFIIAGGAGGARQKRATANNGYLIQQVRKCNRKLYRGDRSQTRNTTERFIKGFQRYDKVVYRGIECFVFGRRRSGYFDLRKWDGVKVAASAKCTELTLLESGKTFLIESIESIESIGMERRDDSPPRTDALQCVSTRSGSPSHKLR